MTLSPFPSLMAHWRKHVGMMADRNGTGYFCLFFFCLFLLENKCIMDQLCRHDNHQNESRLVIICPLSSSGLHLVPAEAAILFARDRFSSWDQQFRQIRKDPSHWTCGNIRRACRGHLSVRCGGSKALLIGCKMSEHGRWGPAPGVSKKGLGVFAENPSIHTRKAKDIWEKSDEERDRFAADAECLWSFVG